MPEMVFNAHPFNQESTRRIIITTNIAETSLTIPGVRHVIDSGRVKQKRYHAGTGMQVTGGNLAQTAKFKKWRVLKDKLFNKYYNILFDKKYL